jgi:hypothetical protein
VPATPTLARRAADGVVGQNAKGGHPLPLPEWQSLFGLFGRRNATLATMHEIKSCFADYAVADGFDVQRIKRF